MHTNARLVRTLGIGAIAAGVILLVAMAVAGMLTFTFITLAFVSVVTGACAIAMAGLSNHHDQAASAGASTSPDQATGAAPSVGSATSQSVDR